MAWNYSRRLQSRPKVLAGGGKAAQVTTLKLQQGKSPNKPTQFATGLHRRAEHSATNTSNAADTAVSKHGTSPEIRSASKKDYGSDYEDNTSNVFKGERQRIKVKTRKADNPDDDTPNLRLNWSEEEHEKFQFAIQLYANDPKKWNKVSEYVGTRTPQQCRGHFSAYTGTRYKRQKLEDPEQ